MEENKKYVTAKCVSEKGKLRIKLTDPNYNSLANCQFPRDIRVEGAEYLIPIENITFNENNKFKFFYRIKKTGIKRVEDEKISIKIFEEGEDEKCVICFDLNKSVIFIPCGHYATCQSCSSSIKNNSNDSFTCPICRTVVQKAVDRKLVEEK
jgi:Zinc finger, C3HC4 type (RING finger)